MDVAEFPCPVVPTVVLPSQIPYLQQREDMGRSVRRGFTLLLRCRRRVLYPAGENPQFGQCHAADAVWESGRGT